MLLSSRWSGWGRGRMLLTAILITFFFMVTFTRLDSDTAFRVDGGLWRSGRQTPTARLLAELDGDQDFLSRQNPFHWDKYPRLNGYYNGLRTLVTPSNWISEQKRSTNSSLSRSPPPSEPFTPIAVNPYTDLGSDLRACFLDSAGTVAIPDVFAYPALPFDLPEPTWGTYEELGMEADQCWDRFGRFGAYGYHYEERDGGFGIEAPPAGDVAASRSGKVDYRGVAWGALQGRCYEKNKGRFAAKSGAAGSSATAADGRQRSAVLLRAWTGMPWSPMRIMNLRALIVELSLKTGGEYEVHILMNVGDESLPIHSSKEVYDKVVQENVPKEFWDITTLWSIPQMQNLYPGLDEQDNIENDSHKPIYSVYRVPHLAMQWFSEEHPEYAHFWNWEIDVRYFAHYYEFFNSIGRWADKQPRKYLWERNERVWIPELHGTYQDFMRIVEEDTKANGSVPVWGPVRPASGITPDETRPPSNIDSDPYKWGVGEAADMISFNPMFNPDKNAWCLRYDITGYNGQAPARRTSIITLGRFSRRLLHTMHLETLQQKHSMFPEMFPGSMALHHGLKAVYAPHPVYFDRQWPLARMDRVFNRNREPDQSVFFFGHDGIGEHNFQTATYYYSNEFAGPLWHRWLGEEDKDIGGPKMEAKNGRMCMRGALLHPVKFDFRSDPAIGAT